SFSFSFSLTLTFTFSLAGARNGDIAQLPLFVGSPGGIGRSHSNRVGAGALVRVDGMLRYRCRAITKIPEPPGDRRPTPTGQIDELYGERGNPTNQIRTELGHQRRFAFAFPFALTFTFP